MNEIPVLEFDKDFLLEKFDEIYQRLEGGAIVLLKNGEQEVFIISKGLLKDLLDGTQFSIEEWKEVI